MKRKRQLHERMKSTNSAKEKVHYRFRRLDAKTILKELNSVFYRPAVFRRAATQTSIPKVIPMRDGELNLVADIVKAYVSNNSLRAAELPQLIADVSASLSALSAPPAEPAVELTPAVNPRRSVFADRIISLENGKPFKSLKRHLSTLGMTPEDYRRKWGLASDYPMVAADYANRRSELAKRIGLGRKGSGSEDAAGAEPSGSRDAVEADAPAKPRRGRARKSVAA